MNYKFPKGFFWGASASGVQTEGTKNKVNESIWEYWFKQEPDRFYNKISNEIACDTYSKYKEDVKLMKDIKLNSFRTSIQWSRLIKNFYTQEVDDDAVEFYTNYFKELKENGIEIIMNLYHFDMPMELQRKYNGFESKEVAILFSKYAKVCFDLFSEYVDYWVTFNEPIVPVEMGYFYDAHYPNKIDPKKGIQVGYNTLLAHAYAVEEYKKGSYGGEIGIILNLTPSYPRSDNKEDLKASEICDVIFNKSFMDPCVKGTFPKLLKEILKENNLMPYVEKGEEDLIKRNIVDFVGLNYYTPRRVCAPMYEPNKKSPWMPEWYFDYYKMPGRRINPHRDDNEIYPKAVYDIAKEVQKEYGNIKWYLAEIGISITDEDNLINEDNMVDDSFRTDLFKEHMIQLHKAIEEGSNCFGVHQWTFIDNWSWLNTHKRRYGFYYLDLKTRKRYIKKHAIWFKELIENNGF